MIDTEIVRVFFDQRADRWDEIAVHDRKKIKVLLDNALVGKGDRVLDVACGTGVLIPEYLSRQVAFVDAIDLSPEMIRVAKSHCKAENVAFYTGDAMTVDFPAKYDRIVIYSAFPHFADGEGLIRHLSSYLNPSGTLTVAHSSSREEIDSHHKGEASAVSNGLPEAKDLAEVFGRYLTVTTVLSTNESYQIVGRKE